MGKVIVKWKINPHPQGNDFELFQNWKVTFGSSSPDESAILDVGPDLALVKAWGRKWQKKPVTFSSLFIEGSCI